MTLVYMYTHTKYTHSHNREIILEDARELSVITQWYRVHIIKIQVKQGIHPSMYYKQGL